MQSPIMRSSHLCDKYMKVLYKVYFSGIFKIRFQSVNWILFAASFYYNIGKFRSSTNIKMYSDLCIYIYM